MANRNFLQLIQRIAPRVALRSPTIALLSQDLNIQKLVSCAQETGDDSMERHEWPVLTTEFTQLTIASEAQTAFPDDFDRLSEKTAIWNRSVNMKYDGPCEPALWDEMHSATIAAAGQIGLWRIIGDVLHFFPAATAGQTIAYTYIANTWAKKADGTPQREFLLDSDIPRIPDSLIIYGARYRFKMMNGIDYAEDMATYERYFETKASHSRGLRVIRKGNSGSGVRSTVSWPGVIVG